MYGSFPGFIMKSNKSIFSFLILLFLVLFFVKTDYRFVSNINCCGDDYDYFSHAVTIGEDFDFDYSNDKVLYPLSLEKIARMYKGAVDNGFASYAEA